MAILGQSVQEAGRWLREGWPVGIPTETVYGLAANACDSAALRRVFETKKRPLADPLIVHLSRVSELSRYALDVPDLALALLDKFSPGPLTLILPKGPDLAMEVSAGLQTAGFRIPAHPLMLDLLASLDFPLAAPSANLFGRTSPTTAQHVEEQLGTLIPYILDGGPCRIGVESTVLDLSGLKPVLRREGGLSLDILESFCGEKIQRDTGSNHERDALRSPGTLLHHYAPEVPLRLFQNDGDLDLWLHQTNVECRHKVQPSLLRFDREYSNPIARGWPQEILSPNGDVQEAAHNLFAAIRRLEKISGLILAQKVPQEGLGYAVNDRLFRASLKESPDA